MDMTDTPETQSFVSDNGEHGLMEFAQKLMEFAQQLERARNQLRAAYEEARSAYELETHSTAQLMAENSKQERALKYILDLSAGWDAEGSTGPGKFRGVQLSWETVARLALDCARSAVSVERPDYKCASTGERIRQVFDASKEDQYRQWSSSGVSKREAAGTADEKPDCHPLNTI